MSTHFGNYDHYKMYELPEGDCPAAKAAINLDQQERELIKIYEMTHSQDYYENGRPLIDTHKRNFVRSGLVSDDDLKDDLEAIGYLHPVTDVQHKRAQERPRAYMQYPATYRATHIGVDVDTGQTVSIPKFYMLCPIGYNDDHFAPEGGRLVSDEKEFGQIFYGLFGEGLVDPDTLTEFNRVGTSLPNDYVENYDPQTYKDEHEHKSVCFLARGRSLAILEHYDDQKESHYNQISNIHTLIEGTIRDNFTGELVAQLSDEANTFDISVETIQNDDPKKPPSFRVSIRENDLFVAKKLSLPENDFFDFVEDESQGRYVAKPKSDSDEMKSLRTMIQTLPPLLRLDQAVPQLIAKNNTIIPTSLDKIFNKKDDMNAPTIHSLNDSKILIYKTDDLDSFDFVPPDCLPFPADLYFWLMDNQGDKQIGIALPPMPADLKSDLDDLKCLINEDDNFGSSPSQP